MSDDDRLREAANELHSWADTEGDWTEPGGGNAAHWKAEATLLRMVAAEATVGTNHSPAVYDAAHALADAILGGTE